MNELEGNSQELFEVKDVFNRPVRTTKRYWHIITMIKHNEMSVTPDEVKNVIVLPDEVRRSTQDYYVNLFYKQIHNKVLVVVVKYIQERGFVITCYKTSKLKRKGVILWPQKTI